MAFVTVHDDEVLSPIELHILEQADICRPSTTASRRKILVVAMLKTRLYTTIPCRSPQVATLARHKASSIGDQRCHDVSISSVSVEMLEFIGLVPDTADKIFRNWQRRPDPTVNPDGLMDYVRGHVLVLRTRHCAGMTPRQALTRIGLTQELQDRLLDPQFSDILDTMPLHHWVEDILNTRHASLCELHTWLKSYVRGVLQERATVETGSADSVVD